MNEKTLLAIKLFYGNTDARRLLCAYSQDGARHKMGVSLSKGETLKQALERVGLLPAQAPV